MFEKGHVGYWLGKKRSKETRKKISIANKEHIPWNKGKSRTDKEKYNIRMASMGRHYSPKTEFKKGHIPYLKLHPEIARRGERHPFYGKHHTVKTRNKISKTLTGKYIEEEGSRWNGGKAKCVDCGKLLSGYIQIRCRKCNDKFKIGKFVGLNAPYWLGGISKEPYSFNFDNALKNFIRRRDNYKCRLCDAPQEEFSKKFAIHHIDYDKKNCDKNNLITLCNSCHSKTIHNREYWTNFLLTKEIIYADRKQFENEEFHR